MKFKEYLKGRRVGDNPQGDFVKDARARMVPDVSNWQELLDYLQVQNACPEAIAAARLVWRDYQRLLARRAVNGE